MNERRIYLCKSEGTNLFAWNEPYEIFVPDDEEDNLDVQFYGMQILKLGDLYLGFVHVFRGVENNMEVYLACSRDLEHWRYVSPRCPAVLHAACRSVLLPVCGLRRVNALDIDDPAVPAQMEATERGC